MKLALCPLLFAATAALVVACGSSSSDKPGATTTPKPVPTPVEVRQEPQGVTLADPAFEALDGATADFGRLGGSVYQIEMPENWNGRLLLYQHGFEDLASEAYIDVPAIRPYLIRNGWAWGASSFSSTNLIPGRAADETAALWDLFVKKYGQPKRTYVNGFSMGGAATNIAAERYADRYDGALQMCGLSEKEDGTDFTADYFAAGAYLAGVTQQQFDDAVASAAPKSSPFDLTQADFLGNPLFALYINKIKPVLDDPAKHEQFEDAVLDLTGGPRAFDREGLALEEGNMWLRSTLLLSYKLVANDDTEYELGPLSDIDSPKFNAGAIRAARRPDDAFWTEWVQDDVFTGDIKMPLLTLHTTGDWQTPINQTAMVREAVESAGKSDLLVQRAVQAPAHCWFTNSEWQRSLEDLVAWVEDGQKPDGEDLTGSYEDAGKFTLAPRFGSKEADNVPGAEERIKVSGTIALGDMTSDDITLFVVVRRDGRGQLSCGFVGDIPVVDGHYEVTVAGNEEAAGCGEPGAEIFLQAYNLNTGTFLVSDETAAWPSEGDTLTFNATLTASENVPNIFRQGGSFTGSLLDANGRTMPPGTLVQAYSGTTLCGVASLPQVVMAFSSPDAYWLWTPDQSGCAENASLSFRINGKPAAQTATNNFTNYETLDLSLHAQQ